MDAGANVLKQGIRPIAAGARAEHISLEGTPDIPDAAARPPHRRTLSTYKLESALRGCSTEVSILEDHYACVRTERPRALPMKYVFDLRFANPKPVRIRHVSWSWMAVTAVLIATAALMMWRILALTERVWTHGGFFIALGCAGAAIGTLLLCIRRTTESLVFTSAHGGATLVNVLGGIGSAKAGKKFFVELIKNINAAKLARPQSKQHALRDEMREHHRLHELNVLSDEEYEASKARILAAHQ